MKNIYSRIDLPFIAGMLMILPAACFFVSAFLNHNLPIPFFGRLIEPCVERPENKSLGVNANLLIVFGQVIAILLNLHHVVRLQLRKKENKRFELAATIQLNCIHWVVIAAALAGIGVLIVYMIGETCNCL